MLHPALLRALEPQGLRERVQLLRHGGFTAPQVLERLPAEIGRALSDPSEHPTVAARHAADRVAEALLALATEGKVRRSKVELHKFVPGQGMRRFTVDAWRR